ncbi:MAG TPA: hypothetical protein VLX44_20435 [Xanthobacteraceae bacterium]|nr:hypothetical protein [Xanthobacteraceae bacterium]
MYIVDQAIKDDPVRRWALSDRVFFACGACHILAYAFLEAYPHAGFAPAWIKPLDRHIGNHIVVVKDNVAFDYHGYSDWRTLFAHTCRKAGRWWPGWRAAVIALPPDVLVSEEKSRRYEGLWLREPRQFLHDALPRAHEFPRRFPAPT